MPVTRQGMARLGAVIGLAALTLGTGLGRAGRLTYHEAFVAQSAREMLANGNPLIPTLGGRPWLEKPPLAIWLVAIVGRLAGGIGETVARVPSAIAAALLVIGIGALAVRRFGRSVALLAALIQATTAWTVIRGRLAEADMLLACLITWTIVAFDHLRDTDDDDHDRWKAWRWAFFAGLGLTCMAKGIGFGLVLVLAVVALVVAWDRNLELLRRLRYAPGWLLAAFLGLTWPLLAAARHPSAATLLGGST